LLDAAQPEPGIQVDIEELHALIDAVPRARIAVLPTGLQPLPRLANWVDAPALLLKRDDLTGLALGGNKTRALEFILGDALNRGCDVLVSGGGGEQSNHAVQCAAAANKVGMDSVMVLQRRKDARDNGNALLHRIMGGRTEWIDADPELKDRTASRTYMHRVAEGLRAEGRNPYVLESSLHPLSVVAYVNALVELYEQLDDPERPVRVYLTSEGAALGGLLLGVGLLGLPWEVIGLDWRPRQLAALQQLHETIGAASALLQVDNPIAREEIDVRDSGGPAYGVGSAASWEALRIAARLEGILLDPVYSAKGMAGALSDLRERPVAVDSRVVFLHTGGLGAIFAYEAELQQNVINRGAQ
jgi:1-aminocyclopropane-1-carboxylate deaminase/D-cysteine desulfhydrase-like pyridoxal-dependent ACC family enzyme